MERIELKQLEHAYKVGQRCPAVAPNVTESCTLHEGGQMIGFYIKDVRKESQKLYDILTAADSEFRSKNVPKSVMSRGLKGMGREVVEQYSTILGGVPEKPHMKRNYKTHSSVHGVKSAQPFIKLMNAAGKLGGQIIQKTAPELFERHRQAMESVEKKWRFGGEFTSSISNYNINANFHFDKANQPNTVNIIYTMRRSSAGGCLYVPDYGACFEQPSGSMLVYPAWRNLHGVTPIESFEEGGYRNSLVFYPLKAFA